MASLNRLYEEHGQSPWLDNLARPHLKDGTISDLIIRGVRGITANPTIVAKAIESSDAYDDQLHHELAAGHTPEDAYWDLAIADVVDASERLRPIYEASEGADGFVSIEVAPYLAHDTQATVQAARELHQRIDRPNLLVKIPATAAGVPAIEAMVAEGRSINVTLVFSLARYRQVLEAYLSGLESLARRDGDLSTVHGVASFFVSRVDTEVDRRLEEIGTPEAIALRGQAAIAQAKLAYQLFRHTHSGERWERLADRGARVQRPLWASTSTKNPRYPDTLYVDNLIGPDTVNTLQEGTLQAFEDHGTLTRMIDVGLEPAELAMWTLAQNGVDLDDVGRTLEREGIAAFEASFTHVLATLEAKSQNPVRASSYEPSPG
ncbi:transaldolase [Nocardioides bigeumensis]|uniref:Transaldolase n=1 Tax=Nocardioides bigeumensis TaxID=433657 RepID=A0ABP5K4S1_9ACTN